MVRTLQYTVPAVEAGTTVERFLRRRGYSHALLSALKNVPDGLCIHNIPVYTIYRLAEGEVLCVTIPETSKESNIMPYSIPISILYEDSDIFILYKPAGLAIHPSQGNRDKSLAGGVAALYQTRNEPFVFRAIGRLDKDTSGLVLLAKNALAGCLLSSMLQRHEIRREYIAICDGLLPVHGTITAPIGRVSGSTIAREVRPAGAHAVTHFKRLQTYPAGYSLA